MSVSGLPFDDIRDLISNLPAIEDRAKEHARERNLALAATFGFGSHEAMLCEWLAGWSGKSPAINRPLIALFAGTHEVSGKSDGFGGESTLAVVTRMAAGGAPVNQACASGDIGLKVFDLALQFPVGDITIGDALDEKASAATIGFGMEAIAGGVDLLGLAAFGYGSEIANAALLSLSTGIEPGLFSGLMPENGSTELMGFVEAAVARNKPVANDPLELLRRLGGREHSALLGAILAARVNHVPVILDGISAICVARLLQMVRPDAVEHCLFAGDSGFAFPTGLQPLSSVLAAVLPGIGLSVDGAAAGHAISVLKSIAATHTNTVLDEA